MLQKPEFRACARPVSNRPGRVSVQAILSKCVFPFRPFGRCPITKVWSISAASKFKYHPKASWPGFSSVPRPRWRSSRIGHEATSSPTFRGFECYGDFAPTDYEVSLQTKLLTAVPTVQAFQRGTFLCQLGRGGGAQAYLIGKPAFSIPMITHGGWILASPDLK